MSGLTLSDIREAMKAQLVATLDRETNVYAYAEGEVTPYITFELAPSDPIDYFVTMTGNGLGSVQFVLRINPGNVDGEAVRRLDDYLSVGQGNGSSIVDALMADTSLGGAVATLTIDTINYFADIVEAELYVTVTLNRVGANA